MVTGIRKFREHFAAHEGQYAIIGGAACDLLFNAAGLDFRATKDILPSLAAMYMFASSSNPPATP